MDGNRAIWLALAGLALAAGCITDSPQQPAQPTRADQPEPSASIQLPSRNVSAMDAVRWNGTELAASAQGVQPTGDRQAPECPSQACEQTAFTLEAGPDGGLPADELVLTATADPYVIEDRGANPPRDLNVRVRTADGEVLGKGELVYFSARANVSNPQPGDYVAEIYVQQGSTPYVGSIHLQEEPGAAEASRDLLPDLVTMPVKHLVRTRPLWKGGIAVGGTEPVDEAAGARGCSPYEMAQRDAINCLRFTNSIGNVGQGPLELRLTAENATQALTPATEARFEQVVYTSDGDKRRVEAGQARYHAAHEHYHKTGLAEYTLYAFDTETDERGDLVREGRKTSWCLVDMGVVEPGGGHRVQPVRYPLEGSRTQPSEGTNCEQATPEDDMVTGITPGWYDMYEWFVPDQFIEITDLPEGTYELVSVANPEGTVLESDPDNNAAGVVFEWADGEATVVDTWSKAPGR